MAKKTTKVKNESEVHTESKSAPKARKAASGSKFEAFKHELTKASTNEDLISLRDKTLKELSNLNTPFIAQQKSIVQFLDQISLSRRYEANKSYFLFAGAIINRLYQSI